MDPRTKIIIVMCLSSLAVFLNDLFWMTGVLVAAIALSIYFKSGVFKALLKLKRFIWVFIAMILVQSIFNTNGQGIIYVSNLTLISTTGLYNGVSIFIRMMIIIVSASIMTTSNSRDIVQGLYQWKIPYELAFMVAITIRFLPILKEEAIDIFTSIQLRGIDLKKIPMGKKIKIYTYIIMPMLASVFGKAQELAVAVEMRGFRAQPNRTSYRVLRLTFIDYCTMITVGAITWTVLYYYFTY